MSAATPRQRRATAAFHERVAGEYAKRGNTRDAAAALTAASLANPLTYYVMLCPSFDCETLIAHRPTFEGALSALLEEHKRLPTAALSVWDSRGNLLVPSVKAAKDLRNGASHG